MSDEHAAEPLDDRPPAEGADPDASIEPVLAAEGRPSQAEGDDPDHPDEHVVLDALPPDAD